MAYVYGVTGLVIYTPWHILRSVGVGGRVRVRGCVGRHGLGTRVRTTVGSVARVRVRVGSMIGVRSKC